MLWSHGSAPRAQHSRPALDGSAWRRLGGVGLPVAAFALEACPKSSAHQNIAPQTPPGAHQNLQIARVTLTLSPSPRALADKPAQEGPLCGYSTIRTWKSFGQRFPVT